MFLPDEQTLSINLADYCAIDGVTDDSTGFTAAYTLAASQNKALYHPGGTLVKGNNTLVSNIPIIGSSKSLATIKLKNGANTDLFSAFTSSINLAGTAQTGSAIGANFWQFRNIKLDGNKANQSSGTSYPIRAYGYGHILEHVEVVNGYTGNILLDWNGSANPTPPNDAFMPFWYDVMSHDCNGLAYQIGGPTDMQWTSVNGFASGSHVVHIAPNCVALRQNHCHFWATPIGVSAITLLNEAAELVLTSCQIEGSDTCALVNLGNDFQATNLEVGNTGDIARQGRGIQLGQQAGQTPYVGQIYQAAGVTTAATANVCRIGGKTFSCNGGALDEKNTTGNIYELNCYQTGGTAIVGGYPGAGNSGLMQVSGLTADGSPGKGGFFEISNASFYGMQIYNKNNVVMFSLDTFDSVFQLKNGFSFSGYADNGSTLEYNFDASTGNITSKGFLATGQSATAPNLGTGGTITTANVGVARVAPSLAATGVILQAGTVAGQQVIVVNEAAVAVTFAASGTSNVANGVADSIAATTAGIFVWDSITALWYRA